LHTTGEERHRRGGPWGCAPSGIRSRLFLVGVAMDLAFVLLVRCHYIMEVRMEKWWNDAMAAEEDTKLSWMDFRLELKSLNCVELKFQV
jgi:hypothetical protein